MSLSQSSINETPRAVTPEPASLRDSPAPHRPPTFLSQMKPFQGMIHGRTEMFRLRSLGAETSLTAVDVRSRIPYYKSDWTDAWNYR